MPMSTRPESLRILCLDGGGIKGYTSLLILKRIFRTMMADGSLSEIPRPCDVFDLIVGTSTGGLIAVMLGRLHMTIDDCIAKYEQVGKEVFGKKPAGGLFGQMMKGVRGSAFYDIEVLQNQVKNVLDAKSIARDAMFKEIGVPSCKVMVCVTSTETSKPDVLRNYESVHPTAENYTCNVWEAASATAAAPVFFKPVKFQGSGEQWCDGGMRRNNPINEALAEVSRESAWKDKKIGCILSLGTGVKKTGSVTSSLATLVKTAVAIMADSDDIARVFGSSELGIELFRTNRYFRFNVPQGMADLQLDDWKETARMKALTTDYLAETANGDLVTRCAKSLLDPDENLQIEIKGKVSLVPYHPCAHFIDRRIYSEALLKFFRSKTQSVQTFVLWGMGGIGKTQIALKFAQDIRHRISVFWIRGDSFTNFATDYAQVFRELDPASPGSNRASLNLVSSLENTRRKLEQNPSEWLLILDNADDLDAFLGNSPSHGTDENLSISMFLPRHGRLLITTRDRRFQGVIAAASDGIHVDSMSEKEAIDLLIGSIPGYLIREGPEAMVQATHLIGELGFLPLAIAQAAANILEQQLTLVEYVSFYHDKKQRMNLMRAPALDFQTTDARNAKQSIDITWQISFDVLKEKHPLSAIFLTYIGCLHWRSISRLLIQRLPEFRDLQEIEFIQLTKKPLNLSLLEEKEDELGFVEYAVHPLVHESIVSHLGSAEISPYLERLLDLIVTLFPFVEERSEREWNMAVYLAPHAARIIELSEIANLSNKWLSMLLLFESNFFGISNLFSIAVDLAIKANTMACKEWASTSDILLAFKANVATQYQNADREDKAEVVVRDALEWIDSEVVQFHLSSEQAKKHKIKLWSILAMSIWRKSHAERETLHRQQLASGLVNLWDAEGINIRHNLAHALFHQSKFDEAKIINTALLEFAMTEEGKKEVKRRLYLIMLNLRCMIIRQTGLMSTDRKLMAFEFELGHMNPQIDEQFGELYGIHRLVLNESLEHFGVEDLDTWKAANNLVGLLSTYSLWDLCGPVLWQILQAGIAAKVRSEGKFAITLDNVTETSKHYLSYLKTMVAVNNTNEFEDFRTLLNRWLASSGCSLDSNTRKDVFLNSHGVALQCKGLFRDAEDIHRQAIEICREKCAPIANVYLYNLMLAIGRQGRLEEAQSFRNAHRHDLEPVEAQYGVLEDRIERDGTDRALYESAQTLMFAGKITRGDKWWQEHKRELDRAEYRYGPVALLPPSEAQIPRHHALKKNTSKLAQRFKLGNL